jgi:hypothetical protein
METKQLQLVTFEQAKRLKELGFDWETTYYYRKWYGDYQLREDHSSNFNGWEETVDPKEKLMSAPTVALALKWFRDEKGFDYSIIKGRLPFEYSYTFLNGARGRLHFKSYETTERALLDELLNILEENS